MTDRIIRTDISMQIVAKDGGIHLLFSEEDQHGNPQPAYTSNFLLSPSDALTASSLLADLAFAEETGLRIPEARKKELVDRHRSVLLKRIEVVMNSSREKKKVSNSQLAQQLVDIMSAEVFA